jgi:hypothetical protein
MRRIAIFLLPLIIVIGAFFVLKHREYSRQSRIIDDLLQSHIDANVPPDSLFDRFLRRDLAKYFRPSLGPDLTVQFDLLRRGPTQVGIGYPKFYLSVQITRDRQLLKKGYVCVAAMEREEFFITAFIPQAAVLADSTVLDSVFPALVRAEIMARIRGSRDHAA